MTSLKLPLEISKGRLSCARDIKASLDKALGMFLNTPKGSLAMDREYGFHFMGLRFEILDETTGTVYNSSPEEDSVYRKKISGSSKNLNTFAAELSRSLSEYEPRLEDISVTMAYSRAEHVIYLSIQANIKQTGEPYEYKTQISVWR